MKRRKFILGAGAAAASGASLLGSGAFTSVEAERSVTVDVAGDANAFLRLAPCKGSANGDYVVDTSNGTIAIDLSENNDQVSGDGVNADALSTFDNVFEICNQGTQDVCVDFEVDVPPIKGPVPDRYDFVAGDPAVVFYRGSDRDAFINTSELNVDRPGAISLGIENGECQCVGFEVRAFGFDTVTDLFDGTELTIRADADGDCTDGDGGDPVDPTPGYSRIYLTNSDDPAGPGTRLLSVEALDDDSGEAILNHVAWLDNGNFDQVDSMAITPDLETLYVYDKNSGHLGKNDLPVANNSTSFVDLGEVSNDPGQVVLGEFVPGVEGSGSRLLTVSQSTDALYEIQNYSDSSNDPEATEIGGTGVSVVGSDIEWAEDDQELYLYTNADGGLYSVDTSTGDATGQSTVGENLTGTALGEAGSAVGSGELIGSVSQTSPGEIVRFEISSGDIVARYDMMLYGEPYDYSFGDMTSGVTDFEN